MWSIVAIVISWLILLAIFQHPPDLLLIVLVHSATMFVLQLGVLIGELRVLNG